MVMMNYVDFLRKVPLFSELEEDDLRQLTGVMREHRYGKNATIVRLGDPGDAFFILKSGLVKITLADQHDREMILRMLYPTDFFGEISLLDGMPRTATVTTLEPTEVLTIYREQFLNLIEESPKILLGMTVVLSRRLRETNESIRSLAFYDVYGKVARVLLGLASEEGRATEQGTVIDLRLTHQELAEFAGISPGVMARTLSDFQQAGCLRIGSGTITILEIDILRQEVAMVL